MVCNKCVHTIYRLRSTVRADINRGLAGLKTFCWIPIVVPAEALRLIAAT